MKESTRVSELSGQAFLPILTFHHIGDRHSPIAFHPDVFSSAMSELQRRNYRALDLVEAVNYVVQQDSFPERSVVITFDDGYRSVYEKAFPVLQANNLTATVFLAVGERDATRLAGRFPSLNGIDMLDWKEVREMHRWGMSFGAHTLTHPDLTRLSPDLIKAELGNSKAVIEDALGAPVDCFAYPFGRFDRTSDSLARKYFKCACTDRLGLVTGASELYALERVDMYYLRTKRLFDLFFSRYFPAYIRLRALPRRLKRFYK